MDKYVQDVTRYVRDFNIKMILIGINCEEMREYRRRLMEIFDSICSDLKISLEEMRYYMPLPNRVRILFEDLEKWYDDACKRAWVMSV